MTCMGGLGTSMKCLYFSKIIKYFKRSRHRSFVSAFEDYLRGVKIDDCWYKVVLLLLKGF